MDTCKICGAPRDPLNTNCKFCGTAYQIQNLTGEIYIAALRSVLTRIDENETSKTGGEKALSILTNTALSGADAKVSAVSTFAMPADVESLLQFLAFCHGNAQATVAFSDTGGDRLKGAWFGKAKMAFTQLKMKAVANPSLMSYIAEYEPIYGVAAKKPLSGKGKVAVGCAIFVVGGILLWVGLMGLVLVMAFGESREEAREKERLDALVQKVHTQIEAGQYNAAEATCAGIHWTVQLDYSQSKELAKTYNGQREELKALIDQARNNPKKQ